MGRDRAEIQILKFAEPRIKDYTFLMMSILFKRRSGMNKVVVLKKGITKKQIVSVTKCKPTMNLVH
jgi:hypothetical protein